MHVLRGALVFVMLGSAALSACSSGSVTPLPIPQAAGTPVVPSVVSATTQPVSGAGTPVPVPAAGTDFASLATLLVAAQPVPLGQAGVVGTIAAVNGATLSVIQQSAVSATDVNGATPDFEQNYASVGTPGTPVTVTLAPGGVVGSTHGFADLRVGETIVAGGSATGSQLSATFIGILTAAPAAAPSVATVAVAPMSVRKKADATVPSGWVSQKGALTATSGVPGAVRLSGNQVVFETGNYPCFAAGPTGGITGAGSAKFAVTSDMALALPQASANFPYQVDSNPSPAAYAATNGSYTGPGPANQWMQFEPIPGSSSAPTYDVLFRADASFNITLTDSCTQKTFTLLGGTIGYGYESNTQAALPGANQQITLTPVKCIDVNIPLHFTLPLPGLAGLNPFGSSQAGLSVCGTPKILGASVVGTPTNIQQASSSGGQFILDPAQSGSASIASAPTFNATGPNMSFALPLQAQSTYTDSTTIEYSLFGQCVIGLPSCSSAGGSGPGLLGAFSTTLTSTPGPTIALHAPAYATCSITDPISVLNNEPPSTNCAVVVLIAKTAQSIPAIITVSNLPQGTYTFNTAAAGGTAQLGNVSPCNGSAFTPYYTVTPTTATGTSVTFTLMYTGLTGSGTLQCRATITDANGNAVLFAPGMAVEPGLRIQPAYGM